MNTRKYLIPIVVVGFIGVLAIGWYLGSPLFINQTVDEAFPFEVPPQEEIDQMSEDEKMAMEAEFLTAVPDDETLSTMSGEEKTEVEEKVLMAAASMPDHDMDEPMPEASGNESSGSSLILQGQFQGADSFHQGAGDAGVYELPDGTYILRLDEFTVTNGPDLHVLLATGTNPTGQSDLGEYLDLGKLKGNLGNQNYELPPGVDISEYHSVVIYCLPFHVIFSTAPLGK
jgi:hypothetical protein